MNNFCVQITIRTGDYEDPYSIVIPLDGYVMYNAKQTLDFSTFDSDPFTKSLCTNNSVCERVVKLRKTFSKDIAEVVTDFVYKYLSNKDTILGYKNETSG